MTTSQDIVNQALLYMGGNQQPVSGNAPNFDTSTNGKAAASFYTPVVQAVARQYGWDFARSTIALTLSGNAAPFPWAYEYVYPTSPAAVQIWQILPASTADKNDPRPVNWSVGNATVSNAPAKVIWTNQASARAYFAGSVNENLWDPMFRESVVRLLASVMSLAIGGKPDAAEFLLQSSTGMETIAEARDS